MTDHMWTTEIFDIPDENQYYIRRCSRCSLKIISQLSENEFLRCSYDFMGCDNYIVKTITES